MSLARVLEPEVMDTSDEAQVYNAMDHRDVNRRFVADLLEVGADLSKVLDLGTGTAQIPIEICLQSADCRVLAVDMSVNMLELARYNIEAAGLIDRIQLGHADAKQLPHADGQFSAVISNSIVHHIPQPEIVVAEAVRVTAEGGWLFFRDLIRPDDETQLQQLVATYAGGENEHARQLFADSLRAALRLEEARELVVKHRFPAESVLATSDRHWTWSTRKS